MRLNRILALLGLAVATGVGLVWVEAQNLRLKQKASELARLHEQLSDEHARLRLTVARLAAPASIRESVTATPLEAPKAPATEQPRSNVPLYMQR